MLDQNSWIHKHDAGKKKLLRIRETIRNIGYQKKGMQKNQNKKQNSKLETKKLKLKRHHKGAKKENGNIKCGCNYCKSIPSTKKRDKGALFISGEESRTIQVIESKRDKTLLESLGNSMDWRVCWKLPRRLSGEQGLVVL